MDNGNNLGFEAKEEVIDFCKTNRTAIVEMLNNELSKFNTSFTLKDMMAEFVEQLYDFDNYKDAKNAICKQIRNSHKIDFVAVNESIDMYREQSKKLMDLR
jgi:hypothetical protein